MSDKVKSRTLSDSGSDSEDDDFVPEEGLAQPPRGEASTSGTTSKHRSKATTKSNDDESDEGDSSGEERNAGASAIQTEDIDADELEALKRERAELIAGAGGEDRLGKRRRLAQATNTEIDSATAGRDDEAEALKAKAEAEWAAIKGSGTPSTAAETSTSTSADDAQASASKASLGQEVMISIPHTYKFAGEVHTTTRLLPRSHPDAVKYLSQSSSSTATPSASAASSASSSAPTTNTAPKPASAPTPSSRPQPGPRRKKGSSLAALSAAVTSKPTKLNTLEKSKLDWDQFKGNSSQLSQHELDELENQTRGGGKGLGDMKGYLERRDFLDRVKDRTGQP